MQYIQIHPAHSAFSHHHVLACSPKPREIFVTPEKKTKPCNFSPGKKSYTLSDEEVCARNTTSFIPTRLFM